MDQTGTELHQHSYYFLLYLLSHPRHCPLDQLSLVDVAFVHVYHIAPGDSSRRSHVQVRSLHDQLEVVMHLETSAIS